MNTKHKFEAYVILGGVFGCLILLIINIFMSSPSSKAGSSMDAPLPPLQKAEGCCQHFKTIPSPADIQRMLVSLGYDIEVDGVIGYKSRKAWDEVVFNQYAEKYFKTGEQNGLH